MYILLSAVVFFYSDRI